MSTQQNSSTSSSSLFSIGPSGGANDGNNNNIQQSTIAAFPTSSQASQNTTTLIVENFEDIFPGVQLWRKISSLAEESCHSNDTGTIAGQQLTNYLAVLSNGNGTSGQLLLNPKAVQYRKPDIDLRRRLSQNPTITIKSSDHKEHEASLTRPIYDDVCFLADSLLISEMEAFSLYFYISKHPDVMSECELSEWALQNGIQSTSEKILLNSARDLYFYERSCYLRIHLSLLKLRGSSAHVAYASDSFLQTGLVKTLIQVIRDLTLNIHMLRKNDNSHHHLQFSLHERQIASECLFFAAYDVQLTVDEVVSLIDIIRDLTNGLSTDDVGLHKLHPLKDVPDIYESNSEGSPNAYVASMTRSPWPEQRIEKNPLHWQRQLVDTVHTTGIPSLLRCISVLVITCIASLDTENILTDRNTHEKNSFGMGNALFPPGARDSEALRLFGPRLNNDAMQNWKRPDVAGLLTAAYTMLLGSSTLAASSRLGGDATSVAIRKTLRELLVLPSQLKSFTFCRCSLIPAIRKPILTSLTAEPSFDIARFLLTSLAEFGSKFLDFLCLSGEVPMSRAKWEESAQDSLRLQLLYQEQQRTFQGQFRVSTDEFSSSVPIAVDTSSRPDCMDDLIAFAVAVSSLHSDYALRFWSVLEQFEATEEQQATVSELRPSLVLEELCRQLSDDDSLRPAYLSFISALALAKNVGNSLNGSVTISRIFTGLAPAVAKGCEESWVTIFETLRHYVRELNPNVYATGRSTVGEAIIDGSSTSYYYSGPDEIKGNDRNTQADQARSLAVGVGSKELGEENTAIILSNLALLANVAKYCPDSRLIILTTSLPILSTDQRNIIGHDDALNILFTLSIMPLRPEVRGSVFRTIACLLSPVDLAEQALEEMRQMASRSWELIHACQIVPTELLVQYPPDRQTGADSRGLSFSPSAAALAADMAERSWIPADPRYSLIYEMEYIESSMGFYPSTEGFLQLLATLFKSSESCLSTVGDWKAGCTAYVEYISYFVLPRAIGRFLNLPRLQFRMKEDFDRLISQALDVLNSVLKSYCLLDGCIVSDIPNDLATYLYQTTRNASISVLRSEFLADTVTTHSVAHNITDVLKDFDVRRGVEFSSGAVGNSALDNLSSTSSNVAESCVKSPGFSVMSDLMSFASGNLIYSVAETLRRSKDQYSIVESDRFAIAYGLYGETLPTWLSAKEATSKRSLSQMYRNRVSPIFPTDNFGTSFASGNWEEIAVSAALKLVCGGIAREHLWNQLIQASGRPIVVTPCLNFERKSVPQAISVSVGRMSQEMLRVDTETHFISSLVDKISIRHTEETLDAFIALAASSVVLFLDHLFSQNQNNETFFSPGRIKQMARAFYRRILLSAVDEGLPAKRELLGLIVDKIVSDFRSTKKSSQIVAVLLGMPFSTTKSLHSVQAKQDVNCLDALLTLLQSSDFTTSSNVSDLAATCYEIVFYVTRMRNDCNDEMRFLATEKLRSINFWVSQASILSFALQSTSSLIHHQICHCASWFLKSACTELQLLAGIRSKNTKHEGSANPQPVQFVALCVILFQSGGFVDIALDSLPLEKPTIDELKVFLPEHTLWKAKKAIEGPVNVVHGYEVIDANLLLEVSLGTEGDEAARSWVDQWNIYSELDCAASHLSYSIYLAAGALTLLRNSGLLPRNEIGSFAYNMLMLTLLRMQKKSDGSLDNSFFETSTRNLGIAARMAVAGSSLDESPFAEIVGACTLLAKVIARSGTSRTDEAMVERISSFSCTMSVLLNRISVESVLVDNLEDFLEAASVILSFATRLMAVRSKLAESGHLRAMTTAVSAILDLFASSSDQTYCTAVLKRLKNDIRTIVSFIPTHTIESSFLLTQVATFPFGTPLLYEVEILSSLHEAAASYILVEEKSLASWSRSSQSDAIQIGIPTYFVGHLRLMNAMLASSVHGDCLSSLGYSVFSIIKQYRRVVERAFRLFPVDKDVIHELLNCLLQIKSRGDLPTTILLHNNNSQNENHLDFELLVIRFYLSIVEFPLPISLLPAIPSILAKDVNQHRDADVINIWVQNAGCWWDSITVESLQVSMNTYLVAAEALRLTRLAFCILKRSNAILQLELTCYCRALCRCVSVVRHVHSIVTKNASHIQFRNEQCWNDIVVLKKRLVEIVSELLLLIIYYVRQAPRMKGSAQLISIALDYCSFDSKELQSLVMETTDENELDLPAKLAFILRTEIFNR